MAPIFPPQGPRNDKRYKSARDDVREYCLFCLEFCSRILETRPNQVETLKMAASCFTELGYFFDGLELDRRLERLLPGDAGVLYDLACSLALTGNRGEAVDTLVSAMKNGYLDHRHMAGDRDLESLRRDPRFKELLKMMQLRTM